MVVWGLGFGGGSWLRFGGGGGEDSGGDGKGGEGAYVD